MKQIRTAVLAAALVAVAVLAPAATAPAGAQAAPSRCEVTTVLLSKTISCAKRTTTITAWGEPREVHWQVPVGTPPAGGWPTVLMFQGALFTAELNWASWNVLPFGAYTQTEVVQRLLDGGYAVITPEAHANGFTFWDTNIPPFSFAWETSPDHELMTKIFAKIDAGDFGPLAGHKLFATGISSGGYMSSRMALAYPDRFKAIAIASASYAPCAGPLCLVGDLPDGHAPTLFLHGALDPIVPLFTVWPYEGALRDQGTPTRLVVEPLAFHQWIPPAPGEIKAWFDRYR